MISSSLLQEPRECMFAPQSSMELRSAILQYYNNNNIDPAPPTDSLDNTVYGPIAEWCIEAVTDFSYLFSELNNFNANISNWDVSSVLDMSHLFDDATMYNQPMNIWDVSSVQNMEYMFRNAIQYNQPIHLWNVSSAINMNTMFYNAIAYNQPLNQWDVSKVNRMDWMFSGATLFNQPLLDWDVSMVIDMSYMFYDATNYNQPINRWDVSKVQYMNTMWKGAITFNQPLNNWNTSLVRSMSNMLDGATIYNQPLDVWDMSMVTDLSYMFARAIHFNQPLSNWNVKSVRTMEYMFQEASNFNQPLEQWDVSNVMSMSNMFHSATSFNQALNQWDVQSVNNMEQMFQNAIVFNQNLCSWGNKITTKSSSSSSTIRVQNMFQNTACPTKQDTPNFPFLGIRGPFCQSCSIIHRINNNNPIMCFSGSTQVYTKEYGTIRMNALRIGDEVLTGNGQYSKIYSFGHSSPFVRTKFLQITTTTKTNIIGNMEPLEISAEHMLYCNNQWVPANQVQIGDILWGYTKILETPTNHNYQNTTNGMIWEPFYPRVISIHTIHRQGAYAPFTSTGDIVVNHVVASNYIAREWIYPTGILDQHHHHTWIWNPFLSGEFLHWIQHGAMLPYRIFCILQPNGGCTDEVYNDKTGLSSYVSFWFDLEQWVLLHLNSIWQIVFIGSMVLPIAIVAAVVGKLMMTSAFVWIHFGIIALIKGMYIWKKYILSAKKTPTTILVDNETDKRY